MVTMCPRSPRAAHVPRTCSTRPRCSSWGTWRRFFPPAPLPVLWALPNATRAVFFFQVTGVVSDADGKAHYVMSGTWDEKMECSKIVQSSHGSTSTEGKQKTVYQTLSPKVLWKKYPLP